MNSLLTSCERKCLQTLLWGGPGRIVLGLGGKCGHCRMLKGRSLFCMSHLPSLQWCVAEKPTTRSNNNKQKHKPPHKTNTKNPQQRLGLLNISKSMASSLYPPVFLSSPLVFDCGWLVYIHILMSFGNCGTYFQCN